MISIIIPVLNEELALPNTLRHVFSQDEDFEVIVVDGGSTDNTLELVKADSRLQLFTAPRGRASQMNVGARHARGEWLLFLHADTQLPEGALGDIARLGSVANVQAGGYKHRFTGNAWGLRVVSWLHNFRCRHTRIFYGDQAMFIRKSLFEELGGYPAEPILEDLLFGEKLVKVTRPVIINKFVTTDSRKFEQNGVWLSLWRVILILISHELHLPIPARKFFADVR